MYTQEKYWIVHPIPYFTAFALNLRYITRQLAPPSPICPPPNVPADYTPIKYRYQMLDYTLVHTGKILDCPSDPLFHGICPETPVHFVICTPHSYETSRRRTLVSAVPYVVLCVRLSVGREKRRRRCSMTRVRRFSVSYEKERICVGHQESQTAADAVGLGLRNEINGRG